MTDEYSTNVMNRVSTNDYSTDAMNRVSTMTNENSSNIWSLAFRASIVASDCFFVGNSNDRFISKITKIRCIYYNLVSFFNRVCFASNLFRCTREFTYTYATTFYFLETVSDRNNFISW